MEDVAITTILIKQTVALKRTFIEPLQYASCTPLPSYKVQQRVSATESNRISASLFLPLVLSQRIVRVSAWKISYLGGPKVRTEASSTQSDFQSWREL